MHVTSGGLDPLRAAFGPAASPSSTSLPPAHRDATLRWARAVVLGARGRYAAAEALLGALRADPGVPPELRAHAAVTRASHLRQVGAHAMAERFDAAAVRLAHPPAAGDGPDTAGLGASAALGDALTGLAADAIGRWDVASAERLLGRAAPWCGVARAAPCRTAVRWCWVRAEASLLAGDAHGAVRAAGTARSLAGGLGSPRHLLKSRLVLAVARAAAGRTGTDELDAVAAEAAAAGLLPLYWPALLAAADHDPGSVAVGDAGGWRPNGRHAEGSQVDTLSRRTVAESRRHAAMLTTNVIYLHSDPVARTGMQESAWLPARDAVPY